MCLNLNAVRLAVRQHTSDWVNKRINFNIKYYEPDGLCECTLPMLEVTPDIFAIFDDMG